MPAQLLPILAPVVAVGLLLALAATGMAVWLIEWAQGQVRGLPLIGGDLVNALAGIESGLISLSRSVVTAGEAWLVWGVQSYMAAFGQLVRAEQAVQTALVTSLAGELSLVSSVLSLAVLPPIEKDIPGWLKELEKAAKDLPNEPAFRAGGPLALLLRWLSIAWSIVGRLGPFARFVALPVGIVLLALLGLVELLGRLTHLETVQAGLIGFVNNLDLFRKQDEARLQSLAIQVNVLQFTTALLQADLETERAARVAALQQEQMARQAATTALEAQQQADRSQWSPLLILAVLAALGAAGVETLRKTAQCDPCAQLDQNLPDLDERISALEAFGEE